MIHLPENNSNQPSVNFGPGLELLMNDKKIAASSSTKVDVSDLDNLENELNDLSRNVESVEPTESNSSSLGGLGNLFNFSKSSDLPREKEELKSYMKHRLVLVPQPLIVLVIQKHGTVLPKRMKYLQCLRVVK